MNNSMDAFTLLKNDHRKVESIFEKLVATTEKTIEKRENLFNALKNELDAHMYMEEKDLYPLLRDKASTHDITLEAYEEHHVVKLLLKELVNLKKDKDRWIAKLTVLKENVEHHVEEEEKEMFPKAQKIIDREDAEVLGKKMEATKKEFIRKE